MSWKMRNGLHSWRKLVIILCEFITERDPLHMQEVIWSIVTVKILTIAAFHHATTWLLWFHFHFMSQMCSFQYWDCSEHRSLVTEQWPPCGPCFLSLVKSYGLGSEVSPGSSLTRLTGHGPMGWPVIHLLRHLDCNWPTGSQGRPTTGGCEK